MALADWSYTEQDGSGDIAADRGKLRGTRIFRVLNYRDAGGFIQDLTGGFITANGETVYNIPERFFPNSSLWCVSASAKGIGVPTGDSDGPNYAGGAIVTAQFETLDYDPEQQNDGGNDPDENPTPTVYATESRSTSAQVLTLERTDAVGEPAWKWSSDDVPLGEEAPEIIKLVPEGDYTIVRHSVPKHPKSTIDGLVGKVNSGTFPVSSSAGGYAAGTLLFMGDDANRQHTSEGVKAWEITLKFAYNPNGWNKIYRPGTGQYEEVEEIDGGEKIYTTASFTPLLG